MMLTNMLWLQWILLHHQCIVIYKFTVISDEYWCWYSVWCQLCALIGFEVCLTTLMDSNPYLKLRILMKLFMDMSVLSVIFGFTFFTKIGSRITNRLIFLACRATFNNTFAIFQSKVLFELFHQ